MELKPVPLRTTGTFFRHKGALAPVAFNNGTLEGRRDVARRGRCIGLLESLSWGLRFADRSRASVTAAGESGSITARCTGTGPGAAISPDVRFVPGVSAVSTLSGKSSIANAVCFSILLSGSFRTVVGTSCLGASSAMTSSILRFDLWDVRFS